MPTRDRDARIAATIARGCGFERPVATLVVRQLAPVTALLGRDDATVQHVLGDERMRGPLCTEVRGGFQEGWRRATMERLRHDHEDWLRDWWLPACSDAELARVRDAPPLRPDHHRVGLARASFPITAATAEMLSDEHHRREVGGSLVVERRVVDALRRVAVAEIGDGADAGRDADDAVDVPPDGIDPDAVAHTGWWR